MSACMQFLNVRRPTQRKKNSLRNANKRLRWRVLSKKIARPKAARNKIADIAIPRDTNEKQIAVGDGRIKIITRLMERVQARKLRVEAVILQARAPELMQDIPGRQISKVEDVASTLDKYVDIGSKVIKDKKCSKSVINAFMECKEKLAQTDDVVKVIQTLIDDAKDDH